MPRRAAAPRWTAWACLLLCLAKGVAEAFEAEDWLAAEQALSLLQVESRLHTLSAEATTATSDLAADAAPSMAGIRDLGFTHVPCQFGHTVEKTGLGKGANQTKADLSVGATDAATQMALMQEAVRPGHGEVWGMYYPLLRGRSNVTGCNLYYTPPKYWPEGLAEAYYGNRTVFGVLRDPYDKMANVFRLQVEDIDSVFLKLSRTYISVREGAFEREGERYQRYYHTCDVNGYLKEELQKVKAGDRFRVDCQLLPQVEYYEGPYGIKETIDNRRLPDSFNELMAKHGYDFRMDETLRNDMCNNVSAYSLDEETKALIREVYARDFELVCKHYGYCDDKEITCLEQFPNMCGSKPQGIEASA